jgi:hypothetical protein
LDCLGLLVLGAAAGRPYGERRRRLEAPGEIENRELKWVVGVHFCRQQQQQMSDGKKYKNAFLRLRAADFKLFM